MVWIPAGMGWVAGFARGIRGRQVIGGRGMRRMTVPVYVR